MSRNRHASPISGDILRWRLDPVSQFLTMVLQLVSDLETIFSIGSSENGCMGIGCKSVAKDYGMSNSSLARSGYNAIKKGFIGEQGAFEETLKGLLEPLCPGVRLKHEEVAKMSMRFTARATLFAMSLLITACLSSGKVAESPLVFDEDSGAGESLLMVPSPTGRDASLPETATGTSAARDAPVVQDLIRRLAERLGVAAHEITVAQVFTDEFPAQNLGCPRAKAELSEPVRPALVVGQEVILEAENQRYRYRVHAGEVVFCGPVL